MTRRETVQREFPHVCPGPSCAICKWVETKPKREGARELHCGEQPRC